MSKQATTQICLTFDVETEKKAVKKKVVKKVSKKAVKKKLVKETIFSETLMPFGKYKGTAIKEVPSIYLIHILSDSEFMAKLRAYVFSHEFNSKLIKECSR